MLFVSLIEPHHQNEHDDYPAPEVYRSTFANAWTPPDLVALGGTSAAHLAGYYGQVKRLDEAFGRLRDALLSMELADVTLVAYTSDHGSHFKTRNGEYKRSAHDASVRVPFLIEGPGVIGGRRVTEPVTTAELAPTLLRAAGIKAPAGMLDGLPVTAADLATTGTTQDAAVLIQISESETGRALRTRRWAYHVVGEGIASHADTYTEDGLWDLDADPYQLDNVIGLEGYATTADALRLLIVERIAQEEGRLAVVRSAPRSPSGQRQSETIVRQTGLRGARYGHQPSTLGRV
jgi:choline-sulfatase